MKTLLVLAQHPDLAEAIRAGLNPEQYRIVHRTGFEEAEPMLAHGLASACIVDVELTSVQGVWVLEKLRRRAPKCPLIIYTGAKQWEWEEEAYLQGATHVLTKPVHPRMLNALLDRLWTETALRPAAVAVLPPRQEIARPIEVASSFSTGMPNVLQGLVAMRGFSAILVHSLDAEAMLKQFLLHLRELIGINRAAIFLRQPVGWSGQNLASDEARRMGAACAIGIAPGLLENFQLSFDAGIGGQLFRLGRIVRHHGDETRGDAETQNEFELLGVQVAVPILDRENVNVENFFNTAPLVKLSVRDNGPGIPPEVLPKIFQPYFTTKGPRQGTGLGLNIVQRLVKEAKGMLEVQTRVGGGTTFSIYVAGAKLIS